MRCPNSNTQDTTDVWFEFLSFSWYASCQFILDGLDSKAWQQPEGPSSNHRLSFLEVALLQPAHELPD